MIVNDSLEQVVARLEYDFSNFELADFIQHIERLKRREIFLLPVPFEMDLSAIWIRGESTDYIFHNKRMHSIQSTHNILHEIAHIILGHTCWPIDEVLPPELLALVRNPNPQGRLRKADRNLRMDEEEQEAEAFVFLIQKRLVTANRMTELMGQSSSIGPLRQWVDSMAFDE